MSKTEVTAKAEPTLAERLTKAHKAITDHCTRNADAKEAIDRYLKGRGVTLATLPDQKEGFRRDCYGAIRESLQSGDWSTLKAPRFDPVQVIHITKKDMLPKPKEKAPEVAVEPEPPAPSPAPVKIPQKCDVTPEQALAEAIRQIAGVNCHKEMPTLDMTEIRSIIQQEAVKAVRQQFAAMSALMGGNHAAGVSEDAPAVSLNTPEKIAAYMEGCDAGRPDQESFWVLSLDRKNNLKNRRLVTLGTLTSSLVHPRETFRGAINDAAECIVCVHNHPSGSCDPSSADLQVTRQLKEAGRTVGIDLLDHVIIGRKDRDPQGRGFYSFSEAGLV